MSRGITGKQIRDETIDENDIKDGSIKAAEMSPESISGQTQKNSGNAANDRLLIWDSVDSTLKKIAPNNLGISGGGGGSPAGTNDQIQFNNGGSFGASGNLVWNNNKLGVGTSSPQQLLEIYSNSHPRIRITGTSNQIPGIEFADHSAGPGGTQLHFASLSQEQFAQKVLDLFTGDSRFNSWDKSSITTSGGRGGKVFTITAPSNGTQFNFLSSSHISQSGGGTEIYFDRTSGSASSKAYISIEIMGNFNLISNGTTTNVFQVDPAGSGNPIQFSLTLNTGTGGNSTQWGSAPLTHTRKWAILNDSTNSDVLKIQNDSSVFMSILQNGNVGVGIANPTSPLHVYGNLNGSYIATIDNDENTNGHVLKLSTEGNGVHSRLLEMEDGDGDTIFRARADGRFGFGPDGVSSMGAGTFVVGIDNSSHTSDIAISKRLQHLGDPNTYLDFPSNDTFNLVAAGNSFLKYDSGNILINNANADVDTKIMADDGNVVLHVDAGTNRVGIGTTGPINTLDTRGPIASIDTDDAARLKLYRIASNGDLPTDSIVGEIFLGGSEDGNNFYAGAKIQSKTTQAWNPTSAEGTNLSFWTTPNDSSTLTKRMTITNSGRIGIGTSSPTDTLDVRGKIRVHTTDSQSDLRLYRIASDSNLTAGTELGRVFMGGSEDGTNFYNGAAIVAKSTEDWVPGSAKGTEISFWNAKNGTSVTSKRMTIANDGSVGIGVDTPNSLFHVSANSASEYAARFFNDGDNANRYGIRISCGTDVHTSAESASAGDIRWIGLVDGNGSLVSVISNKLTGDKAQFVAGSDQRIKTDISDSQINAINVFKDIEVKQFRRVKNGITGSLEPIGFIAQNVESVIPDMVQEMPWDGYDFNIKTMGDSGFIPYLVKAVKELIEKNESLEAKILELENKVE
tara:strand:+ start:3156 stop:5876 length:2721 start_codon:yes stop_codon:yes gene_type:complete